MGKHGVKIVAKNKKAYHDYTVEEKYEAGIVLQGTEIKSVRAAKVQLKESFARIKNGEVFIHNMHISEFTHGNRFNHDPLRVRKLLVHKSERLKLEQRINRDGYTLVPLAIYLKDGFAKMELGLAKGKKTHDKRHALKEKDAKREVEKAFRQQQKY
ncbi:MAG: SsrA-binding protein SmpB [Culicoidibacterales bacterium]